MVGAPGSGKSMMAKRLPSILPPLSLGESLETTKIHSVAGKLNRNSSLITQRPFRDPHHTISQVAMVGGGSFPQPGEISLAHNGILFLDELPEFNRNVLEVLRQPLEDRRITISRIKSSIDYPASFTLVASMNPCPCGYYNHPTKACVCSPGQVQKYLNKISGPLLDRMEVIELPSYTEEEKRQIALHHLLPRQMERHGLKKGQLVISEEMLAKVITGYTREAGVRNLERTITSVLRKCARKIASGEAENVSVTGTSLEKLLGPRMVKPEFLNRTNAIGIANGLAWTSIGGETLPIEVQVIDNGSGKITVTGSLGDVMKESAQLAITYARVHAAEYGIDSERLKKCDLHIHAPEGAVPKDGPSAGVTLTTALISCLSGIPVRGDVAMTGEIPLHGNVLPIGGLREKSMAAYREGMKTVLIPKDNVSDLYEVDDEVKKNIEFLPMSNLSQVLAAALLKPKTVSAGHPRTRKVKPAEAAALPQTAEKPQPGAVC